ncbi:H-2 class II histocompatibility antigen, E-S beta chain-like [Candoia aspera]|uniref:H-2 class II histocompatibility antigen, E-S beta chain-like n=1 Tax=Candoia aspera TaxID=51853 RepID=UPI002FD869DC
MPGPRFQRPHSALSPSLMLAPLPALLRLLRRLQQTQLGGYKQSDLKELLFTKRLRFEGASDSSSGAGSISVPLPSLFGIPKWGSPMGSAGVPLLLLLLLLVGALCRIAGSEGGKEPPAHFLHQVKGECRFLNGTQRVRYLQRSIYDRQETDRFDSELGKFVAVTELGQPDVDLWNSDKGILQDARAAVDRCRYNYGVLQGIHVIGRRAKPTVTISPTKADPASPNTILLCTATGFYPLEINIRWLKNGRPEKEGVAFGEELQNGDWTYQRQVMLETRPERGDVYACQVGHASLEAPITIQWEPRSSNSARSKLWTGAVGAMLGVAFLAVGLSLYLKSKKGESLGLDKERWGGDHQPPSNNLQRSFKLTMALKEQVYDRSSNWQLFQCLHGRVIAIPVLRTWHTFTTVAVPRGRVVAIRDGFTDSFHRAKSPGKPAGSRQWR